MVKLNEMAERFEEKSSFKIKQRGYNSKHPEHGGLFILANHENGEPIKKNEPPINIHLIHQIGTGPGTGLRANFYFMTKPHTTTGHIPCVTAEYGGLLSMNFEGLTLREVAFAMRQARLMHQIMKGKIK